MGSSEPRAGTSVHARTENETATVVARERLIAAAIELMAARPPSLVSGREVARRAEVNYGLLHHYFGGKNGLFREALAQLVNDFVEDGAGRSASPSVHLDTAAEHAQLWRVLANLASDPQALDAVNWNYPVLRHLLAEAQTEPGASRAEHFGRVAAAATMTLGWMTFQNFIRSAMSVGDEDFAVVSGWVREFTDGLWRSCGAGVSPPEPTTEGVPGLRPPVASPRAGYGHERNDRGGGHPG
jgi:AcrR family transcriptional regulator